MSRNKGKAGEREIAALLRDLTDTMYNPALPPYVDHQEGTRLVVEFIEKFWCPTVHSRDILADRGEGDGGGPER